MDDTTAGRRLWLYKRPFAVGLHEGMVLIDARTRGLATTLWIDGTEVAHDFTPAIGEEAVRNHRLAASLPDGRPIEVEAGYINYSNAGIAVRVDGEIVHESHPGKAIAFPARAAKMVRAQTPGGNSAYDLGKLKRNKVPILVDVATTLLFFVIAKFTDLRTAALAGAAIGVALLVVQRFVRVDLIGGMALFGIFMLLVSAGFALAFEDDELIKQRSTIVGLIGAGCFLVDGLLGGKRLGRGVSRYLAYADIDERRLALAMGAVGATMALSNFAVVRLVSTDAWLFYTTFGDVPLSIALVLFAVNWARKAKRHEVVAA